jgi:hypothetical protein
MITARLAAKSDIVSQIGATTLYAWGRYLPRAACKTISFVARRPAKNIKGRRELVFCRNRLTRKRPV